MGKALVPSPLLQDIFHTPDLTAQHARHGPSVLGCCSLASITNLYSAGQSSRSARNCKEAENQNGL
jgi:hypothetical protein